MGNRVIVGLNSRDLAAAERANKAGGILDVIDIECRLGRGRRRIVDRLKPDGVLVLAGILAVEFGEVQKTFAELGLKLVAHRAENEWCSGSFCFS